MTPGGQRASTEYMPAITGSIIAVISIHLNSLDEVSYETRGSEGMVFQGT